MTLSSNQRFLTSQPANAECPCMRVFTEPRTCSSTSTTLFFQLRLQPHEYALLTVDLCNKVTASVITTDTTLGRKTLTLTLLREDLASWVIVVRPSRPRGDPKDTHPSASPRHSKIIKSDAINLRTQDLGNELEHKLTLSAAQSATVFM